MTDTSINRGLFKDLQSKQNMEDDRVHEYVEQGRGGRRKKRKPEVKRSTKSGRHPPLKNLVGRSLGPGAHGAVEFPQGVDEDNGTVFPARITSITIKSYYSQNLRWIAKIRKKDCFPQTEGCVSNTQEQRQKGQRSGIREKDAGYRVLCVSYKLLRTGHSQIC